MLDAMKHKQAPKTEAFEALQALIAGSSSFRIDVDEPPWEEWVARLGLPAEAAGNLEASLRQLWLLPFADRPALADLLLFRSTQLPQVIQQAEADGEMRRRRLCSLFELMVDMALQGNSVFPQNPTHIAQQVRQALETPIQTDTAFEVLLQLLISPDGRGCRPGFNFPQVTDLGRILEYEHGRRAGSPEWCWRAAHKYDLFAAEVRGTPEFREDWRWLGEAFKLDRFRDPQGIIRRSPLVEGNWRKPNFSDLAHEDTRFQIAFDFFCWKWFLYGMHGDEPMVQKLAVTLTPFGTQIFIPGFWSLDPGRDINWTKVTRLHRARGISKQGTKLADIRQARAQRRKRVAAADQTARRRGLVGEARYQLIKQSAGLVEQTDNAQVRRDLRQAGKSA
jgi:hypothetical protein